MTEKIVLRLTPKIVILPNGTTFTARYEGVSRKDLPSNIKVKKVRTIGARNKNRGILSMNQLNQLKKISNKKRVRFDHSAVALKKMRRNKRKQTGKGLASDLANLGIKMGSKAINFVLGKKLIKKRIENIPNVFKYGVSKVKNKNIQRALNSDIANYVVEEAQNKVQNKALSLFD